VSAVVRDADGGGPFSASKKHGLSACPMPDRNVAEGSGFSVWSPAVVVTNAHVLGMLGKPKAGAHQDRRRGA